MKKVIEIVENVEMQMCCDKAFNYLNKIQRTYHFPPLNNNKPKRKNEDNEMQTNRATVKINRVKQFTTQSTHLESLILGRKP